MTNLGLGGGTGVSSTLDAHQRACVALACGPVEALLALATCLLILRDPQAKAIQVQIQFAVGVEHPHLIADVVKRFGAFVELSIGANYQ